MRTVRSSSGLSRGGVCLSACWDTNPPPPPGPGTPLGADPPGPGTLPRGQTDTCKNNLRNFVADGNKDTKGIKLEQETCFRDVYATIHVQVL